MVLRLVFTGWYFIGWRDRGRCSSWFPGGQEPWCSPSLRQIRWRRNTVFEQKTLAISNILWMFWSVLVIRSNVTKYVEGPPDPVRIRIWNYCVRKQKLPNRIRIKKIKITPLNQKITSVDLYKNCIETPSFFGVCCFKVLDPFDFHWRTRIQIRPDPKPC
jgi:hypothetical protein